MGVCDIGSDPLCGNKGSDPVPHLNSGGLCPRRRTSLVVCPFETPKSSVFLWRGPLQVVSSEGVNGEVCYLGGVDSDGRIRPTEDSCRDPR